MTPIPQTLAQALEFHRAGKLQKAERYYRYILQADPQHVETLHLLGVLCHQTGRDYLAIAYISEALRLEPDFPEAHNNLGSILAEQGRLDEAVAAFRLALQLNPDYADAWNNLGNALRRQKKLDEAAACRQQLLRLKPDYAESLTGLSVRATTSRAPIVVEIAAGELIDKITILQIKSERLTDAAQLAHVRTELEALGNVRSRSVPPSAELDALTAELKQVNESLWQIEDDIRACENVQDFGPRFVELARSVYQRNDHRAALKRRLDVLLGSRFTEEKSYAGYGQ